MPRGVPARGMRLTKKRIAANPELALLKNEPNKNINIGNLHISKMIQEDNINTIQETDEEIAKRLNERFEILESFTIAALHNKIRSLIVSGPPGLGKSFTVEQSLTKMNLEQDQDFTIVKGYVRPTGLYKTLWQYRNPENVIIFDDADSIFNDETSINFLKTACDTTEKRRLSYLSEYQIYDEKEGMNVPGAFDFDATVIFITNLDFDRLIDSGNKLAPHLSALVSRSHYIDLTLKTYRDYIVRIKQVLKQGLLSDFSKSEVKDILQFIEDNYKDLRELSLRMAIKLGHIRKMNQDNWTAVARVTCCRQSR